MDHYDDDYNGRSRWPRFGALGLGAVVLAVAAFGIGRLSAPASGSGQQQHATVTAQGGPGPTRVENGVPVGYAHTPEGAVAAATNYLTVMLGPMITRPATYRTAIDTLSAPQSRQAFRDQAEKEFTAFQTTSGIIGYAQQGRVVVFRTVPLAYRVDKYDGQSAQVSIWAEGLLAVDGQLPVRETWATGMYTVTWTVGDWKLVSNVGGSDGPAPATTQTPVQTVQLPPQLKDFKTYFPQVGESKSPRFQRGVL